jgi:hypothetical protein
MLNWPMFELGHSRPRRADGRSGDVGSLRFATDGCGPAEFRDVPIAEVMPTRDQGVAKRRLH